MVLAQRGFTSAAPKIRNSLPEDLTEKLRRWEHQTCVCTYWEIFCPRSTNQIPLQHPEESTPEVNQEDTIDLDVKPDHHPTARKVTKPTKFSVKPRPVTEATTLCQRMINDTIQREGAVASSSTIQSIRSMTIIQQQLTSSHASHNQTLPAKRSKIHLAADDVAEAAAKCHNWTADPVFSLAHNIRTIVSPRTSMRRRSSLTIFWSI